MPSQKEPTRPVAQKASQKSTPVSTKPTIDGALLRNLIPRMQERMRLDRHTRAMERLSQVLPATSPALPTEVSGEFLPGVHRIPLHDLAARWKVSPAMVREAANAGLFRIVITEDLGDENWWFMDKAVWPHGDKMCALGSTPRIVHNLVKPPCTFSATAVLFFPLDELTRVEEKGLLPKEVLATSPQQPISEDDPPSDHLSTDEAAELVGHARRTIYNWKEKYGLQVASRTRSGRPRYRRDDLFKAKDKAKPKAKKT